MLEKKQTYSSAGDSSASVKPFTSEQKEASFRDILNLFLANKTTFIILAASFLSIAVAYLNFATYKYTAKMQVVAAQQENGGISGGFGGLAAMAGISLSQSGVSPFSLYTRGVQSRQAAELLARDTQLMREVFASEWDEKQQTWVEPKSAAYWVKNLVKKLLGAPTSPWSPPGAADLEAYLQKNIVVKKEIEEPFITVTFQHPNPDIAQSFLQKLHTVTDQYLRARTLARTEQYIAYLNENLATVSVSEHREALATALSEQEKQRMAASADVAYAGELVGPISVSKSPTTPNPFLVIFTSLIFGIIFGSIIVLIRS